MMKYSTRRLCVWGGLLGIVYITFIYRHNILAYSALVYWKANWGELNTAASLLHHHKFDKTRFAEVRKDLKKFINIQEPVLCQANTKIGYKYYGIYFKEDVKIDEVKRGLLAKTFPPKKSRFSKCAIVGNGGILKNSSCGKEIDKSDFVFRMNMPRIQEFVNDAGRKTNLTSIACSAKTISDDGDPCGAYYSKEFLNSLKEYNGYLLWVPSSWTHASSMKSAFTFAELLQKNSNLQLVLSNAEYSHKFSEYWHINGKSISSGMTMVSIGLSFCEEIHLYGFWPFPVDTSGNSLPMHYSEDIPWTTYQWTHGFSTEFSLLTELHRQGVLKLHVENCDLNI
ncbi:alpha-2,8-sialyltransferase 8B-like [Saccoglossus kowalevskii]|uniref:Alpha-2,8-sialyltransferase 8B-like n=1 Tax=Saccoglossus kowalevskii TaxID=10224 RepID=A0ABM0LXX6_SACKO|nr:PREDICTED: alpha-2,8-sialyltransferase 8B-like [Saccoglossus kowalevskii]